MGVRFLWFVALIVLALGQPVDAQAQGVDLIRDVAVNGTQRVERETVRSYLLLQEGDPALVRTLGEERKPQTARPFEATYRAPYLAHTTMEPMNCTARVQKRDGKVRVEVWMPNQSPTLVRLLRLGWRRHGLIASDAAPA